MMRKVFSVALMAAMVCLVGMTRDANAAVTLSLVWSSTSGAGTTGTDTIVAALGDTIVLDVIMTSDETLFAHGVSIEFDADLADELNLAGTGQWAGSSFGTTAMSTLYAPIGGLGTPTESTLGGVAGIVNNYNSGVLAGPLDLPAGTYTIGTAAFVVTGNVATDGIDLTTFISGGGGFVQGVDNMTFIIPTHASASVNVIPEPGTASLLGLGLVGLVLAGRRSRRS